MRVWFSRRSNRLLISGFIRFFLALFVVVGVVWGALHLPFISVRSVSMTLESDVDRVLRGEVLAYAEELLNERVYGVKGKTRFFFRRNEFEALLRERFLKADTVSVTSDFWNAWYITVMRRYSFGTYCADSRCLLVDTKGVAFVETDMRIGVPLIVSDGLTLGEYVFGSDPNAVEDFGKVSEIVLFLENDGLFTEYVSLRRDTRIVHIKLENTIGIWLDADEALYDTTRALYVVFQEIFADPKALKDIVSVDVRDPLSVVYERI